MSRIINSLKVCLERSHIVRTAGITLVAGTWLTLFNHATTLLGLDLMLWVRVVSTSQVVRRLSCHKRDFHLTPCHRTCLRPTFCRGTCLRTLASRAGGRLPYQATRGPAAGVHG